MSFHIGCRNCSYPCVYVKYKCPWNIKVPLSLLCHIQTVTKDNYSYAAKWYNLDISQRWLAECNTAMHVLEDRFLIPRIEKTNNDILFWYVYSFSL